MSLVADPQVFTVSAYVDQTEITELQVGQKAQMTLDTLPDAAIAGTVSSVSLTGTNTSNVITYGIKINVDEPSTILRDQMSVNISIVTDEVADVLVIPSEAVITRGDMTGVLVAKGKTDSSQQRREAPDENAQGETGRQRSQQQGTQSRSPAGNNTGNSQVSLEDAEFVQIEIGLDDGTNVEVKSGLSEGQVVIIQAVQQSTGSSGANSNRSGQGGRSTVVMPMGGGGPPMR
jgi:HlyD family secretion protein